MTILEAQGLQKIYTTRFGGNQVQALSLIHIYRLWKAVW